jgi:Na+-transporting NADH:ubiquinone oxidoreductase subunit A
MTWGLIILLILLLLFIFALLTLGEGLLKVAASQSGVDGSDYSVIPNRLGSLFSGEKSKPAYLPAAARVKHLRKGFNINLAGAADKKTDIVSYRASCYSIKPTDFIGMSPMPKLLVEIGTQVKAGQPLFFDKKRPDVIYVAPISGELTEVTRGDKRRITGVTILADQGEIQYYNYNQIPSIETSSREELVKFLLGSGAWPFIRQRPFDTVANESDIPKAIFVSTFDSAPLAPDLNLAVAGKEEAWFKGLEVLAKLSGSKVHIGLNGGSDKAPAAAFVNSNKVSGVETHWFDGPHPAGNVGVQIHHTDPVLPGSTVWYTDVHGVILLGTLLLKGIFDTERVIALTGTELKGKYVKVHQGANVEIILGDMTPEFGEEEIWAKDENGKKVKKTVQIRKIRVISGDVLSGTQIDRQGFLGFYDDQITTVKEGNYYEMFGWLIPVTGHPTLSGTFPAAMFSDISYVADTNTNGEKRAFVMSGEYESVLPMDIYPQHIFRAIMCNDIEKMEGLGILELGEEDVALCEFVCTSKQPLQKMLREGLETLRNS